MYKQAIVNNLVKIAKLNTLNATGAAVGAGIGGTGGYLGSNWLSKKLGLKGGGSENDFLHKRLGIDPNSKYRKYGDIALRTLGTAGGAALGGYGGYLGGDALHNKYYANKPTEATQEPISETTEPVTNNSVPEQDVDYTAIDNGFNGFDYMTKDYDEDYNIVGFIGNSSFKPTESDGTYDNYNAPGISVRKIGKNGERYMIYLHTLPTGRKDTVHRHIAGRAVFGGNSSDLTPERIDQLASVIGNLDSRRGEFPKDPEKDPYTREMLRIMPDGLPKQFSVEGNLNKYHNVPPSTKTDEERSAKLKEISDALFNTYGNTPISDDPDSVDNRVRALLSGNKPGFIGLGGVTAAPPEFPKEVALMKKYYGDNVYTKRW